MWSPKWPQRSKNFMTLRSQILLSQISWGFLEEGGPFAGHYRTPVLVKPRKHMNILEVALA